jgi:hypothetical protein
MSIKKPKKCIKEEKVEKQKPYSTNMASRWFPTPTISLWHYCLHCFQIVNACPLYCYKVSLILNYFMGPLKCHFLILISMLMVDINVLILKNI